MKALLRWYFLPILVLAFSLAPVASAQDAPPPVSDQGVARLSLIRGDVSTRRGNDSDWVAGALNQPLVTGDAAATSDGARTELQLDFANLLRLDGNAEAQLANLTRSQIQVQIGQGIADYITLPGDEAEAEIDTPNLGVHPHGATVVRVQVNSDQESVVTVRSGSVEISTPQGSVNVDAGQSITVDGTDDPQYQIQDAAAPDEWDQWNQGRDRQLADARSWGYTDRYYTGAADLDAYGRWVVVPGYGDVWQPAVQAGWVPYRDGQWVYEPAWGWTWVAAEPWGWAPYHYGRWFYYQTGWVWWPGPVLQGSFYRPVWAPAYVSFIGLRAGAVSVGVGFGSVGWVPIGPGDPFHPWWGAGAGVRVVAPLVVTRPGVVVYANLNRMAYDPHVAAAVVVVHADSFGRGRVVPVRVAPGELRGAEVIRGALPVAPVRESYRVSGRAVAEAALPRAAAHPPAHFYGTRVAAAPAATRPGFHSFGEERPAAPARGTEEVRPAPSRGATPAGETRPASRGSETAPAARGPEQHTPADGWHSFQPQNGRGNDKTSDKNGKNTKKPDAKRGGGGSR